MQKNNLCPLPNKVLVYEEIDTISQSIFNSKASKYFNKNNKNSIRNLNQYKIDQNILFIKFQKYFDKNYNIFFCNFCLNKNNLNKKNCFIWKYYNIKDSKMILPKREFYFRHHLEFLERPNMINTFFNRIEKEYGVKKSNEYQNQKKKEILVNKKEENNQKIFDTNVLDEIENYSTSITQASNNEKMAIITPFEILRKCEDNKRLFQKEKNLEKNNDKNTAKEKDKDVISKLTFSESGISNYSKNIIDESFIKIIKDLSEKPKKYKQEEKKLTTFFSKRKEVIQKITKLNKNINNINANQKINSINIFIKKGINKEKRLSTSNNKKNRKLNVNDSIKQSIIKNISNSKTKINTNYTSLNLLNKKKVVLNLKRQSYKKKRHTVQLGNNLKNSINNMNNINKKNLVSISITNIDDLLNIFLTPKNNKNTEDKNTLTKKQNKKHSALTVINNVFENNQQKNKSEEKYKKIKNNKLYKPKSPLIRLFMNGKINKNEEIKSINFRKRKSVLNPEQHNSLLIKSMNLTNRKKIYRCKNKQNNAVTLSQNFDSVMKNLLK